MSRKGLHETNSGVKKKGDIEEVAEFAEEVEKVMDAQDVDSTSVDKFETWRPHPDDDSKNIEKRTVEEASIPETEAEKKSEGVKKDMEKAGKAAREAGKKIGKGEVPEKEVKKTTKRFFRPIYSGTVKVTRDVEEKIYSKLMLKLNPYFFDAREFSANITEDRKGQYIMDVNVPDKNYREALKDNFSDEI